MTQQTFCSGQYSGVDKPNSSYHKKIAKFEESVTVLASLRKPVKINILLDNGEKHSVLVKGGEDLRTDQRVMQVSVYFVAVQLVRRFLTQILSIILMIE